ncbi:Por secretion system C-terminal sorting domain-containing protein [Chryseobacterium sp. RU37D]|uniref:reprolysin-like metallopeptidase n=1 Tax=Chryseobacterium sp. RU37D TaxID=1907397 RepID=UPI000956477D|nr:zinc-dependent metalloprotease family protein [Chryseobacterium sp. RU37D]SIP97443.1 Por secretion system C-terminal sorting domain-containing protein [Chryseobacterium sp. RU37D]
MKKFFTSFLSLLVLGTAAVDAQWSPTIFKGEKVRKEVDIRAYYSLDISELRSQLANAQETGPNSKAVEISLPTMSGKVEKFAVYSFPVMAKDLADQYQLGSYVGVGVDDPSKYLRFSLAPNDFQSMIIKGGEYEFIEPVNSDKTVYGVHPKSRKNENGFLCSTGENPVAVKQVDLLLKNGRSIANQPTNFAKSSDKKYRTLRLVMSTTGEYTQFFGGVSGAMTQINATITRVNGVFEKDFAVHLNLLSYPGLIYSDPTSDPYATVTNAAAPPASWNTSLRDVLATNVGQANYDIGHLFGASGGGGNAGCVGCVCISPVGTGYDPVVGYGKGSGITSPATGSILPTAANPPSGDNFDIDYVAHEMGHQLGANHTFSHDMQGAPVQMEPGSGSTIMGYAGITGTNTDVQPHSDAYFHVGSIDQVQANLDSKTCDVETTITNNPPVIDDLPTYNIPKGTAFVLTANVTDPENDPMTYTWEEIDNASVVIDKTNLGTTATGASFRSVAPTTVPTRYFPKLSSVLNGVLDNSGDTWEAVSQVARTTNFAITARDNNPTANQQQTDYNIQTIIVGNDGPFKVNTQYANVNTPTPIDWAVVNTTAAPYNVANVKIDYTTDNGTTWTTLAASTPNDGSESFTFPSSLNGQVIKLRVSSIGNVFYAIGKITITTFAPCDGSAVTGVATSGVTYNSANVSWAPVLNATYIIRYRKVGETIWQQTTSTATTVTLSSLADVTNYEVQVAAVCSGTPGAYSTSVNFTTLALPYCQASSDSGQFNYISNVTLGTVNNTTTGSTYSNFTTNTALQPTLVLGSTGNSISVSVTTTIPEASSNGMAVWIDFNKNGAFEASERVLDMPITSLPVGATPVTGTFTVPATAVTGTPLRMRAIVVYATGNNVPDSWACENFPNGEVEDYAVIVNAPLATNDVAGPKNDIQLYPNPVSDILNITKVSDKAAYKIYSAAGQLVKQGIIINRQINVSELIKGAYVISIDDKGKDTFNSKFIKK